MSPEEKARLVIDKKLIEAGWVIQDMNELNPSASLGVAVREYPTSSGEMDYALFIDGQPVGVIEAKRQEAGEYLTVVEAQNVRYSTSKMKYIPHDYRIRFAYEATDKLIHFTDYDDIKHRARTVFSFAQPAALKRLLDEPNTIRNNLKNMPTLPAKGFRDCQVAALSNLDKSMAENHPRALVQMATCAGKTFTAITAVYRMLKFGNFKRILFLVDTRSLGEQAEREFCAYHPNDDARTFSELYGVLRLRKSSIPSDVKVCISTIQRMHSILKGEELDESVEETSMNELTSADFRFHHYRQYNVPSITKLIF